MPAPIPDDGNVDRRRSPRVSCAGVARIVSLPSDGLSLPGRLRDLSAGGCGIETVSPLDHGTRAEILLHVNTASFRVVGQVRAVRVPCVIGVEFLQLSGSGRNVLAELVRELARQQAIARSLRAARQEPDRDTIHQHWAALNGIPPLVENLSTLAEAEKPISNDDQASDAPIRVSTSRSLTMIDGLLDLFI